MQDMCVRRDFYHILLPKFNDIISDSAVKKSKELILSAYVANLSSPSFCQRNLIFMSTCHTPMSKLPIPTPQPHLLHIKNFPTFLWVGLFQVLQ